ncbi:glycerophosphodiester phosphodiesterase [Sediminibacillus massiliensis]|uniref:glycerophosphodiester phosphodiesterase n=1 Tax=Sediminibacillus massiliensis TaxID=1926277 RepID=UPI0009884027|nr:glycerophosphodiester phosphodiesterase [Sediminibacillus massiliensis]
MSTMVYAHRGASKHAPENTFPAFQSAFEMGAEGIETDVQLTRDHIPVLIHDEKVNRTSSGIGFVKDYTYEQLRKLDFGSWFSPKYTGTTILSLEEFLAWSSRKKLQLNIELKNNVIDYPELEKRVYDLLIKYKVAGRTTISSFNPASIERIKHIDRKLATALLTSQSKKGLVEYARELGANALHIKYRLLSEKLVAKCQEKDMAVRVYTVNKTAHMRKCFLLKSDAIFTDVPDRALQLRDSLFDL